MNTADKESILTLALMAAVASRLGTRDFLSPHQ